MPGRPGGHGKTPLSATLANAFISICCLCDSGHKGELVAFHDYGRSGFSAALFIEFPCR